MKLKRASTLILIAVFIQGCASTPTYQEVPDSLKGNTNIDVGFSELLKIENHTLVRISDKGDVLYQQNYGGGGAAVGVLLGPFGVAANVLAIESNTKAEAKDLYGKISFSPKEMFLDAMNKNGIATSGADGSVVASPYILVSKGENDELFFASCLLVESSTNGQEKWTGRYMYQVNEHYNRTKLNTGLNETELSGLKNSLDEGFSKVADLYLKDNKGELVSTREMIFKSEFVSPRFQLDMAGKLIDEDSDRVNIRSFFAVYSLPKEKVTITYK